MTQHPIHLSSHEVLGSAWIKKAQTETGQTDAYSCRLCPDKGSKAYWADWTEDVKGFSKGDELHRLDDAVLSAGITKPKVE